ncbi:hypothetical protein EDC01DRAFT_631034 [Geopyxis carbonaria]|nr:hypothetical protein EDC01DRAFT_631034 [Geopyxis carbonaria]
MTGIKRKSSVEPCVHAAEDVPTAEGSQSQRKKRGGKAPGSQSFLEADKERAFDAMRAIVPTGSQEWDAVAVAYSRSAKEHGRKDRDSTFLKKFYTAMIKTSKPTGAPQLPWEISEARQIEKLIAEKVNMFEGDESDLEAGLVKDIHELGGDVCEDETDLVGDFERDDEVLEDADGNESALSPVITEHRNDEASIAASQPASSIPVPKKIVMSVERASRQKQSVSSQSSQVMERLMQMT